MIYSRVSPAKVLMMIRDGESSRAAIAKSLCQLHPELSPTSLRQLTHRVIAGLRHAGLVEQDNEGALKITDSADRVVNALNLSLTQLAQWRPGSLLVQPLFGAPTQRNDLKYDVFVLMPFGDDLLPVYEDHIKGVCADLDLSIARADNFFAAESIVTDIWTAINSCRIVIADCTRRNPNVFYEIGLSHAVGRSTVLLSQSIDDVPFDLRHIRCITYEYTPRGMKQFQVTLKKTLETEISRVGGRKLEPSARTDH